MNHSIAESMLLDCMVVGASLVWKTGMTVKESHGMIIFSKVMNRRWKAFTNGVLRDDVLRDEARIREKDPKEVERLER